MITDRELCRELADSPFERAQRQAAIDNAFYLATLDYIPEEYVVDAEPVSEVDR